MVNQKFDNSLDLGVFTEPNNDITSTPIPSSTPLSPRGYIYADYKSIIALLSPSQLADKADTLFDLS